MLKPISREEVENRGWGGRKTNQSVIEDINDFVSGNAEAAVVTNNDYADIYHARQAYANAAKKMDANIIVSTRGGKLYLIKPRHLADFLDPDE